MTQPKPIKLIVIGDGQVGKTSLLITYALDEYPEVYVPTVFENHSGTVNVNGEDVSFELWDTAESSFKNVEDVWMKEVMNYPDLKRNPIILVGTKTDIRGIMEGMHLSAVITHEQGARLAKRIGATRFFECSAKNRIGIKEIFDASFGAVIAGRGKTTESCKCALL